MKGEIRMKITQEGKLVRFQLVERINKKMQTLFDFRIHRNYFEELKEHMIKALQEFKLDD